MRVAKIGPSFASALAALSVSFGILVSTADNRNENGRLRTRRASTIGVTLWISKMLGRTGMTTASLLRIALSIRSSSDGGVSMNTQSKPSVRQTSISRLIFCTGISRRNSGFRLGLLRSAYHWVRSRLSPLVARTASRAVTVDFVAPPLAAAIVTTFIANPDAARLTYTKAAFQY